MEPLISVIVPVYNTAGLLPRCVDSLFAQTCKDIEIILIDDGSTDGAGSLCTQYAREHENITAILQENRGVSAARNAGIAAARGRYLGFVDSDDWIEPEMYEALLAALTEHGTQISACGYRIHRYDGVLINEKVDPSTPSCLERKQALESLIHPRGIQGFLCNKLLDRELLLQAGNGGPLWLDERIYVCEDLLFISQCVETAGRVAYDNRSLYVYCVRYHGGPEKYDRKKRVSELLALEQLVESWSRLSPDLGAFMRRQYTKDSYHILREAAAAGDRAYLSAIRVHLRRYLWEFIRSKAVLPKHKAIVLLTFVFPNLVNQIKIAMRGKKKIK